MNSNLLFNFTVNKEKKPFTFEADLSLVWQALTLQNNWISGRHQFRKSLKPPT